MVKGVVGLGIGLASITLASCGEPSPTTAPTQASAPAQPAVATATPAPSTLPESLTFSGLLAGTLTTAINVHSVGHSQPQPDIVMSPTVYQPPVSWTRCSRFSGDFDGHPFPEFEVDIVGVLGGHRYALEVNLGDKALAEVHPGQPVQFLAHGGGVTVDLIEDDGKSRNWVATRDNTITFSDASMTSGTLKFQLDDAGNTMWNPDTFVQGGWRCV